MTVKITRTITHGDYQDVQVSEDATLYEAVAGLPDSTYDPRRVPDIVLALVVGKNEWGWVTYGVEEIFSTEVWEMTTVEKAREALREAIVKHGGDGVKWVLDAPVREFDETWTDEMDALVNTGECEIRSWYTASGNPVVVRVEV